MKPLELNAQNGIHNLPLSMANRKVCSMKYDARGSNLVRYVVCSGQFASQDPSLACTQFTFNTTTNYNKK